MSLPNYVTIILTLLLVIIVRFYFKEKKSSTKLKAKIMLLQSNQDYLISILKDIQDVSGYGSDMTNIIEVISNNFKDKFPYSTISSIYIKRDKLVFKSELKEAVSHAFVSKIKDNLVQNIKSSAEPQQQQANLPIPPAPNLGAKEEVKLSNDIEESITGVAADDMANSEIKSSLELKIMINNKTEAIINISSTSADQYSEEDRKIFSSLSILISDYMTRLDVLLGLEKSKSLSMINSFTDGIFMIDRDENMVAMNRSAMNFLNIHKDFPALNDILSALPNTYNFRDKIEHAIKSKVHIEEDNVSVSDKIFKISITPILEVNIPGSNVIGASILLKDVTLEKTLAQLRDDFTNVMVHELRSPLTAIKASSEFLVSQADLTNDERNRLIEMISESTKKMLDKISLILDSAKLDAGLFTLRKTQADIKKLIQDRIKVFTPLATEKSIDLKVDVDPNIPMFSFDTTRIDEVINNLLSNSLKFTPEKGTISIQAMLVSDKVMVSVTDTGSGIPKDKQSKLFARYQQAPSNGEHVGTGLGLYVVKEIVEDHGGNVSLVSDEGQGTTISFTLPLHPALSLPKSGIQMPGNPQKMVN
jgi:signal transduction histidine kinase